MNKRETWECRRRMAWTHKRTQHGMDRHEDAAWHGQTDMKLQLGPFFSKKCTRVMMLTPKWERHYQSGLRTHITPSKVCNKISLSFFPLTYSIRPYTILFSMDRHEDAAWHGQTRRREHTNHKEEQERRRHQTPFYWTWSENSRVTVCLGIGRVKRLWYFFFRKA